MEKDIRWKRFFEDKRRYADIINGLGCGGRQLVSADDIQEEEDAGGKRSRDILRRAALGMNFVIAGIENQEEPDYGLPFRSMAYDAGAYGKQMRKIRREVRSAEKAEKAQGQEEADAEGVPEKLMPGEYLYGFRKESRLHPVITFVLYSGEKPWDGARRLHEMLDFTGVPECLQEMTPDYKINVIEIRKLEHTEVFRTDVKQVFDFIRLSGDKEALLELVEGDAHYRNMEEDAAEVITAYANAGELREQMERTRKERKEKGGKADMCKAIRDLMEDSRAEGLAVGREEGRTEGRMEGRKEGRIEMLRLFLYNGGSEEDAMKFMKATREDIKAIRNAML